MNKSIRYVRITDGGDGHYTIEYLPNREGANAIITTASTIALSEPEYVTAERLATIKRPHTARRNCCRVPVDFPAAQFIRQIRQSMFREFDPNDLRTMWDPLELTQLREAQARQDMAVMRMRDARKHRDIGQRARRYAETRPRTRCRRSYGDVR